jgi:hypothetical protein
VSVTAGPRVGAEFPLPLLGFSDVSDSPGHRNCERDPSESAVRDPCAALIKEDAMSVSGKTRASDKFAELSERAREAGKRVAAAQDEARAEVERHATEARAASKAHADKVRESAGTGQAHVSKSWKDVQTSWSQHIDKVNENLAASKRGFDITLAVNDAEDAEGDAMTAIDFASGAIEEAEASVLHAISAWKKADELGTQQ